MINSILRKEEQKTNIWSGGKTRELFLHPAGGSYAARDFSIRISSADVEQETSIFTSLPGFHRILMPLTGTIKLVHEGHGQTLIRPYQAGEFEGGWHTTCYGKCSDIGLMLAEGWEGSLFAARPGEFRCEKGFTGVYALIDHVNISIKADGKEISESLNQGDFMIIETPKCEAVLTLSSTALLYGAVIANVYPAAHRQD